MCEAERERERKRERALKQPWIKFAENFLFKLVLEKQTLNTNGGKVKILNRNETLKTESLQHQPSLKTSSPLVEQSWAVVVAQLVEQSLPIPEIRGSNPVIGKKIYLIFTVHCIETSSNV